ncbi:glycoside hydrolase family 18 protein [Rhodocollybia butyracea]|uniref:Glycoside hydrolase family 18 protein n=1 Tax=Rhodocollybia butyracea TaxID=206335 RepID=A0A9P5PL61_9AGAR|nr:glycoside hydrolase family 18 protein [Rhodocollybia butyracea]
MFFSTLVALSSLVFYGFGLAHATPVNSTRLEGLSDQARDILAVHNLLLVRCPLLRSLLFIVTRQFVSGEMGPPPVADVKGFNVFAMSFLLTRGAFDKAAEWTQLTAAQRASIKSEYAAAGITLVVSAFGSTDTPTSAGADPIATANQFAAWVIEFGVDGIDVDYEDFDAFNAGTAEAWLISFTTQLRKMLPQGKFLLTHAPVAPWFRPNMPSGGYLAIHKSVGSMIDWYNIQFYNQGTAEYTTCAGLLTASSSALPESALFQIAANGVTLNKLVIGKPATAADAPSGGFIAPTALATCVEQAKNKGWSAGVMVWEYPDAAATWIAEVRADSWPV